jgi:hypothetical protein
LQTVDDFDNQLQKMLQKKYAGVAQVQFYKRSFAIDRRAQGGGGKPFLSMTF